MMGSKSIFKMHLKRYTLPDSSHILVDINWDRVFISIHFFGRQCPGCDDCGSLCQRQIQALCWDLHSERRKRTRRHLCPSECHRGARWAFSCGNYAAKNVLCCRNLACGEENSRLKWKCESACWSTAQV